MEGLTVRSLAAGDAEAFGALVARAIAAGELAASADPHGTWTVRYALRDLDHVAVAELEAALVGFVLPSPKVTVVEPAWRRRGIGRALLLAAEAIERRQGNDAVIMGVLPEDAAGRAFLEACGFRYHSTVWDLDLAPGIVVARPAWPDGVTVRAIDRARDLPAWVRLFNDAFATHPTPIRMDLETTLADWGKPSPASDDDIAVAVAQDGSLLGFCSTEPVRLADGGVGPRAEIWTVGVRTGSQGLGLGRQLLRWGIAYLRGLGAGTVTLAVNGTNGRALALYESEGFVRTSTRERWSRPIGDRATPEG